MRATWIAAAAIAVVIFGELYGYPRALVGIGLAAGIFYFGSVYFRSAGASPPEPEGGRQAAAGYTCSMCGLTVSVEVQGTGRPPTHCREPMKPLGRPGAAPLEPVD